jgi:hypothetical protein
MLVASGREIFEGNDFNYFAGMLVIDTNSNFGQFVTVGHQNAFSATM